VDAAKFDDKERTRQRNQALGDGTETGTQLVFDSGPWKVDLAAHRLLLPNASFVPVSAPPLPSEDLYGFINGIRIELLL
jgi:hypothetical protein